jgi:hypothetical protein
MCLFGHHILCGVQICGMGPGENGMEHAPPVCISAVSLCEAFAFENLGVFFFLGDGKMKSVLILLYDECLA